jgi:metal-dependent hydrolase (beta-lactamase superfamily II)
VFDDGKLTRLADSVSITPNLILLRTNTKKPTVGIYDEISLLIRTTQGPYLITACSHTSVATIVDKAMKLAGEDIFQYIGGARLAFRGVEDTKKVAAQLKARKVKHVSPGHCSVDHNVGQVFEETFPMGYVASRLGRKVMLTAPKS